MPPSSVFFRYHFHPAGQGIFASGEVVSHDDESRSLPFRWVFDCGSTAPTTVLRPLVKRYRADHPDNFLNLLCISHFDKDHVSGLGDLLDGLHVDTVVMPYWSSIERLMAAATDGDVDPDYAEFLGNPVAFILERAASVRVIRQIGGPGEQPSDTPPVNERPPDPERGNHEHPRERPERRWEWKPDDRITRDDDNAAVESSREERVVSEKTKAFAESCGTELLTDDSTVELRTMDSRFPNACWEFVFHHKPIDPSRARSIGNRLGTLVHEANKDGQTITDILRDAGKREVIRQIYQDIVPPGESVNSTSLCTYSGPHLETLRSGRISTVYQQADWHKVPRWTGWPGSHFYRYPNISILYTGDADFTPAANRQELMACLGPERWERIGILQVPHHGSRYNWQTGSAGEFPYCFSVFCADETNGSYNHPHREVLLELLSRRPVLVNKRRGAGWRGLAHFSQFPG